MKIKYSGAKYSSIVKISEKIKELENKTNEEYLKLNRGVNMVVNMGLSDVIKNIDFDSDDIQIYPPNNGILKFRRAINIDYFDGNSNENNIFITNGGMSGLDLIMKTLKVDKIYNSEYYWGAYKNIMKINNVEQGIYSGYDTIYENLNEYKNNALIICDPNNPIGGKYSDKKLLDIIRLLNNNNTTVIFDSPYRKLFIDNNDFYKQLLQFENVIITESFSKRMGLSGQRIGFVHTINKEFNKEFNTNLLYATNGINTFSQILVYNLLTTNVGKISTGNFKNKTVKHIQNNIKWLNDNNLLTDEFNTTDSTPMGIFVVIKPSQEQLLKHRIGSVSLSFFTNNKKIISRNYSRICVSVNHDKFVKYFTNLI